MTIHRVRLHGRGGQGAVTAAKNLAPAIHREDRNVQAIPSFGVERRGAPVEAYLKFTDDLDERIPTRTYVHEPDYVVIMDESLIDSTEADDVTRGLASDGTAIVNTRADPSELDIDAERFAVVDAGAIAEEVIGKSKIVNTVMLGSFAAATDIVSVENVEAAIRERFPENRIETNVEAVHRGYEETGVPVTP